MRRLVGLLVCATACGGETTELALQLIDGGCAAEDLAEVAILSIEVYGNDEELGMCALSRRCLFNVDMALDAPLASVADMEQVLSDANQPLIDILAEGANYFKLVARKNESGCWSGTEHPACGEADLADADDGVLPVTIRCEPCAVDAIQLCP